MRDDMCGCSVLICCLFVAAVTVQAYSPLGTDQYKQGWRAVVTETILDSPVKEIQLAGSDGRTVLLSTDNGRLYRSTNAGKELTDMTGQLTGGGMGPTSSVTVERIIVDPLHKDTVVIVGSQSNHFISDDTGSTFSRINHRGPILSWIFHPINSGWALMSSELFSPPTPSARDRMLFVTLDMGRSFGLVVPNVFHFGWGGTGDMLQDRIYFTHNNNDNREDGQFKAVGSSENADFCVSTDLGESFNVLVPGGYKFVMTERFAFVVRADPVTHTVDMLVSTYGSDEFKVVPSPHDIHGNVLSLTMLDASEDSVVVAVVTDDKRKPYRSVLRILDARAPAYEYSIPGAARTKHGEFEFHKVAALEGVYISNWRNGADYLLYEDHINDDSIPVAKRQECVISAFTCRGDGPSFLYPPHSDSKGQPIECAKNKRCFLRLDNIYSVSAAPGLVMATGTIVSPLPLDLDDEVNTYLSRDGGRTWLEAHKGAYTYEFFNSGTMVVMANNAIETNQVVFSWNDGNSWFDFDLSRYEVNIDNIVTGQQWDSPEFLIYGSRGWTGVMYHINLNDIGLPSFTAGGGLLWDGDYEPWAPTGGHVDEEEENSRRKCMRRISTSKIRGGNACGGNRRPPNAPSTFYEAVSGWTSAETIDQQYNEPYYSC
eukprot:GHVS01047944.1.p1 GENE.GHVS01047944.1~~GHVS01047944.1.p1  ORF type:complete len:655 (+),score=65.10 GHVS01047944.1:118-2082(+)